MAGHAGTVGGRGWNGWRVAGWGFGAALLLAPLVAMQFDSGVDWTGSDFLFAGVLIGGVGLIFELAVRTSRNIVYRAGVAFALVATFFTLWANGAVGMIGNEENAYNLLFIGVILLALVGAVAARFRARGMAIAMLAAAVAQACAGLGGLAVDPRGAIFSTAFAVLWLLSAALFRTAAGSDRAAARSPV